MFPLTLSKLPIPISSKQERIFVTIFRVACKFTNFLQDPVLFSWSLPSNLDPFKHYDDTAMWKALEYAHLRTAVEEPHSKLLRCVGGGRALKLVLRTLNTPRPRFCSGR